MADETSKIKILREISRLVDKIEKDEWDLISIEEMRIYPGNDMIYEMDINYKEKTSTIRIEDEELLSPNKFRLLFYHDFGVMLEPIPNKKWSKLLTEWRTNAKILEKEEIGIDDLIKNVVTNYINNSKVVDNIEYSFKEGYVFLERDNIFVPSVILNQIFERKNIKISLRKISYIMKDYISSNTVLRRIRNRRERFWVFQRRYFEINETPISFFETFEMQKKLTDKNVE